MQIVSNLDMDDLHCRNMPGHHPLQEIIPCVAQVVPHSAEDLVNLSCNLKTFALQADDYQLPLEIRNE